MARKPSTQSTLGGKNAYENSVIASILGMSTEKLKYSKAKKEWEYRGEVVDHGPLKDQIPTPAQCQFCGHQIRYGYVLNNRINQKKVEVGSECIGNFMEITPSLQGSIEMAKQRLQREAKQKTKARRMELYSAAQKEVWKLYRRVDHEYVVTSDRNPYSQARKDWDEIRRYNYNAQLLYDYITDGRVTRLARKYGVPLDTRALNAFVKEARTILATKKKGAAPLIKEF